MIIYPAIDIYNGRGVRLQKGDFNKVTDYGAPKDLLEKWSLAGSQYIHIVDLNAAKQDGDNKTLISALNKEGLSMQVGGGIRTFEQAKMLVDLGVDTFVIGTAAIEDEALLMRLLAAYPNQCVVGVDVKNGYIGVNGWLSFETPVEGFIKSIIDKGAKRIVYTDINKDGMLNGPNFEAYEALMAYPIEVIASGGITTIEDVIRLKEIGVKGAIIGKALYEKTMTLEEALDVN